jgi:hypothetical protein
MEPVLLKCRNCESIFNTKALDRVKSTYSKLNSDIIFNQLNGRLLICPVCAEDYTNLEIYTPTPTKIVYHHYDKFKADLGLMLNEHMEKVDSCLSVHRMKIMQDVTDFMTSEIEQRLTSGVINKLATKEYHESLLRNSK